jgi:hypothetical protein
MQHQRQQLEYTGLTVHEQFRPIHTHTGEGVAEPPVLAQAIPFQREVTSLMLRRIGHHDEVRQVVRLQCIAQ